jgi:hypothetical protein
MLLTNNRLGVSVPAFAGTRVECVAPASPESRS